MATLSARRVAMNAIELPSEETMRAAGEAMVTYKSLDDARRKGADALAAEAQELGLGY